MTEKKMDRQVRGRPAAGVNHSQVVRRVASETVRLLLDAPTPGQSMTEASVHLPRRGRVYVAAFTGLDGQIWRTTGTTDYDQALRLAREWEAHAREERAKILPAPRRAVMRARRAPRAASPGPLTQQEVADLLNLSVRAVRDIERRALRKLFNHPLARELWRE